MTGPFSISVTCDHCSSLWPASTRQASVLPPGPPFTPDASPALPRPSTMTARAVAALPSRQGPSGRRKRKPTRRRPGQVSPSARTAVFARRNPGPNRQRGTNATAPRCWSAGRRQRCADVVRAETPRRVPVPVMANRLAAQRCWRAPSARVCSGGGGVQWVGIVRVGSANGAQPYAAVRCGFVWGDKQIELAGTDTPPRRSTCRDEHGSTTFSRVCAENTGASLVLAAPRFTAMIGPISPSSGAAHGHPAADPCTSMAHVPRSPGPRHGPDGNRGD